MPPDPAIIRPWIVKAEGDLRLARLALAAKPPLLDGACFHCQQAAGKAIKGLLEPRDSSAPKIHALGPLLDLCDPFADRLRELRPDLLALSHFAVATRYPSAKDPTGDDARNALLIAEKTVRAILDLIPAETRP